MTTNKGVWFIVRQDGAAIQSSVLHQSKLVLSWVMCSVLSSLRWSPPTPRPWLCSLVPRKHLKKSASVNVLMVNLKIMEGVGVRLPWETSLEC